MKKLALIAGSVALVLGLATIPVHVFAQEPTASARPAYPQRTATRLYEQLGSCNADIHDLQEYAATLSAQLGERDQEIAKLKAELAKSQPQK